MKIGMITGADTAQAKGDWRYQCPLLALRERLSEPTVRRLSEVKLTLSDERRISAVDLKR